MATTAQRAGVGATLVLLDVDPQAVDVAIATTDRMVRIAVREC